MVKICKITLIIIFLICLTGCRNIQDDIRPPLMNNRDFIDFEPETNTIKIVLTAERNTNVIF